MAKSPKTSTKPAEPVVDEDDAEETTGERDYTRYKDLPASELHEHFTEWIQEKVGITFASKKEQEAFGEGVRLGTLLRQMHQASDENKERQEAAKAAKAQAKQEKAARKAAKAEESDDDADGDAEEKPKAAKGKPAKKAAAAVEPEPEAETPKAAKGPKKASKKPF